MATSHALDYRTAPDDRPRCATHPLARGTEQCVNCGGPACDVCATFTRAGVTCATCEPRLRRRRWGAGAAALALVAGVVALLPAKAEVAVAMIPSEPAGRCEEPAAELAALEKLLGEKDRDGARDRAARFETLCEGSPQMLYLAAMNAHDAEVAVEEADHARARAPREPKSWERLARAHVLAARTDLAILDYRQALTLQRGDIDDSEAVAALHERSGRPCEASLAITHMLLSNYLIGMGEEEKLHAGSKRARELWRDPACRAFEGSGRASFKFTDERATVREVAFGSSPPQRARFVIDSRLKAPIVVSRSFAARAGLSLGDEKLWTPTPWKTEEAAIATSDAVHVQGATVGHVVVAVVDDLSLASKDASEPLDGVIGVDLLRRFHQTWTDPDRLELSALRDWAELSTEGPLDDLDDVNANLARSRAQTAEVAAPSAFNQVGATEIQ